MRLREALSMLADIGLPVGDHAVFGSGPLLVRGIIDDANDLDVVARGAAWGVACNLGTMLYLPDHEVTVASFYDGAVTVGTTWAIGDFDINAVIDTAEMFDGVPFAALDHVVAYKEVAGRPKDIEHLRLIRTWLASEAR